MSIQHFIELSSKNRNRIQYPYPALFEVPFGVVYSNQQEQIKGAYLSKQIKLINTSRYDTITSGVIDYLWTGNSFESGNLNFDNGTGQLTPTNQATISLTSTLPSTYIGKTIVIKDGTSVIGTSIITNYIHVEEYVSLIFNQNHYLLDGYTYKYFIYPESGIVVGSSVSSVSVKGLGSIYKNVIDYYIGYTLTTNGQNSTITSYDPSTFTFYLNQPFITRPIIGSPISISDPSTNSAIVLPGIDDVGNSILDYSQSYHDYFLVNETRSLNTNIVFSKISSYNYSNRTATLETPFASWSSSDKYSLRKSLPNEFITISSMPSLIGSTVSQLNTKTITVSGLNTNFNYTGLQIMLNGYPANTISETKNSNTTLVLTLPIFLLGPTTFTIIPTFTKVQNYPQLSLLDGNCIFLGPNANPNDNYYAGQYIYIYPPEQNQQNSLVNLRGNCFYINSYIGNGYNVCYVNNVDTTEINGLTFYYPSYSNKIVSIPSPRTLINIVSFSKNNYNPLMYTGSIVSQSELVAYEINLLSLILPNTKLTTGSNIAYYPYVYVEFTVVNQTQNIIYSNNPKSNKALFLVTITDIKDLQTTPFIKLYGKSMYQTIKFRPNDTLKFSVFLPDGTLFQTIESDYYSPSSPNSSCQIDALFGITRIA